MKRSNRAFRLYLAALAACVVLSLLPSRWSYWTGDVAAIVQLPTVPFGVLGGRLNAALRADRGGPITTPDAEHAQQQLEHFRALYLAERDRNESLMAQIDQLQRAERAGGSVNVRLQNANIVGRNVGGGNNLVTLDVGVNRRIIPGSVAVYDGTHLIGRVVRVFPLTSTLVPITDESNEFLEAKIIAPSSDDSRLGDNPPRVQLRVTKEGTFVADVPRSVDVHVGDLVLLFDQLWPDSAQAMTLGSVRSLAPRDDHPLLQSIVVRPQYDASRIATVTVKNEDYGDAVATGGDESP